MTTKTNLFLIAPIVGGALATGALAAPGGEEFLKVPLQVNVLKGVTITDADIAEIVKEANKVLKKANIGLDFDKGKNIKRDFNDQGNNDDKIDSGEDEKLDKESVKELKDKFGDGKGYKVVISNQIHGSTTSAGLSPHDPDSPVTYISLMTTPKVKGNKAKGNDLAHEFGHVFTLGKNHKIDDSHNADDSWHHPTDKNNLMYPYNNGDTIVRGGDLTDDQKEELRKGAKKRAKTKVKSESSVARQNNINNSFVDDVNDMPVPFIDLFGGSAFMPEGSGIMEFTLALRGMFPEDNVAPIQAGYDMFFNVDNDNATGDAFGPFEGVDKVLGIHVDKPPTPGAQPFVQSTVFDVGTGMTIPLGSGGFVERIDKLTDVVEAPDEPFPESYYDKIHVPLPWEVLGLPADVVPIGIESRDQANPTQFDQAQFELVFNPGPQPDIFTLDLEGQPGDDVLVSGSGFEFDGGMIDVLLDDDLMGSFISFEGEFSGNFPIPPGTAPGNYFVTARDQAGGFDFTILTVLAGTNPGDMNGDGVFDAFDVPAFELALADPQAYIEAYPGLDPDVLGDMDGSGVFDAFDVPVFEQLLAGVPAAAPEPTTVALLGIGALLTGAGRRRGVRRHTVRVTS